MTFTLTVRMDNDAFTDDAASELHRILCRVAQDVVGIYVPADDTAGVHTQTVRDVNGNRVGGWKIAAEVSA